MIQRLSTKFTVKLRLAILLWAIGLASPSHNLQAQSDMLAAKKLTVRQKLIKNALAPTLLIGYGVAVIPRSKILYDRYDAQHDIHKAFPGFHTHADDFLLFAPVGAVYGLDWSGIKAKNDFLNRSLLLAKSGALAYTLNQVSKYGFAQMRPDSSDKLSFFSGHTTGAFVAATFMHKEYGEQSAWYSVGAYSVATATGVLRMLNNKHWLSDVLVGAGVGILSTNVVYLTHQYRWGKKPSGFSLMPYYFDKSAGLIFVKTL